MRKKVLKSLALATILTANVVVCGVTAFAIERGVFNFSGTNVSYSLTKGPTPGGGYNYADAATSWAGKGGYVVTAYAEAVNKTGERIGDGVFGFADNNISIRKNASGVYAFNGSHAVAHDYNVYDAIVTTWTNIPQ
ncbi:hypothetical protein NX821_002823 [Clostridium septicum]|uniref:hypothetical protein n=1 Tax=Clostridium septicum TaxID=1504 RepID=UPI003216DE9F